jgi:Spy/CpxP family protein refolding chaperone
MWKTILITVAVVGVIAVAGVAWAKHSGYCRGYDRMSHITERISRKLDLNDEQRDRLLGFAKGLRGLREHGRELRSGMREEVVDLLAAPQLDRERAAELVDRRIQAMVESKQRLIDAFADFSDSLEPEQRTRLVELMGERLDRGWGHASWAH